MSTGAGRGGEGQERSLESMNGALMLRIHVSMSDFLDVFLECFLIFKYLTSLRVTEDMTVEIKGDLAEENKMPKCL